MKERRHRLGIVAFVGYVVLQGISVLGLRTPRFPDSLAYTQLSFAGDAKRLQTVPLVYTLLPADSLRIFGQVLLASAAWWFLSNVCADMVEDRRVRLGLRVIILLLGVIAPVASWNSTILSESITLSLSALMIAVWVRYARDVQWSTAAAAVGVTIAWTFTRPDHVVLVVLILAVGVVAMFRRVTTLIPATVVVALALTSVAGFVDSGPRKYTSGPNLLHILDRRILANQDYAQWFVDHGMPYNSSESATDQAPYDWILRRGEHTYVRFVLEHPYYTFIDPLPYFSGELSSLNVQNTTVNAATQPNPRPSFLAPTANYGRVRPVVPSVVESLLFDQGEFGEIFTLIAVASGLTVLAYRRFGRDPRIVVPALVAASAIPQAYVVWLGGGETTGELDRQSMALAVSLRVALWVMIACSLDRLIGRTAVAVTQTTAPNEKAFT